MNLSKLRRPLSASIVAIALVAAACSSGSDGDAAEGVPAEDAAPIPGVVLTDVSDLVKSVQDGVVSVAQAQFEVQVGDFLEAELVPRGVGTGIVIDGRGHILTNFHVIEGAESIVVTSRDGRVRDAQVVGEAPDFDLALLRVEDPTGLEPIRLGSSEALEVGDPVIAIGNALGIDATAPTVSVGIVSARDRTITPQDGPRLQGLLQTDTAINPGNSGGPLLNALGEVIGINTLGGSAQSVGFAIAIDDARSLIERFLSGSGGPYLGVQLGDNSPQRAAQLRLPVEEGSIVLGLSPGPGSTGGLEPGDVIVEANGEPVRSAADLGAIIDASRPGDVIELEVIHESGPQRVSVTVGERPVRVGS